MDIFHGSRKLSSVIRACTGTHDGKFLDIEPTGQKFKACLMNFYYLNDRRKIVKDFAAEALLPILEAVGLCTD